MSCNEKSKDFPGFYWQIIKSWNEIKNILTKKDLTAIIDIRRQTLWLNKNIKTKTTGKEIRWDRWHKAGINIIHDIINENGQFLSANEIETKYNTQCNIMQYNMLKESIPRAWRQKIKTMKVPNETISFQEVI
jgi:hypothetical protein